MHHNATSQTVHDKGKVHNLSVCMEILMEDGNRDTANAELVCLIALTIIIRRFVVVVVVLGFFGLRITLF